MRVLIVTGTRRNADTNTNNGTEHLKALSKILTPKTSFKLRIPILSPSIKKSLHESNNHKAGYYSHVI